MSGGLSKSVLKAIKQKQPFSEMTVAQESAVKAADSRSAALESNRVIPEDVHTTLVEVFGDLFVKDPSKAGRLVDARADVLRHLANAGTSFLAIGRTLIDLDRSLTKVERTALKAAHGRIFPFSEQIASMLRTVAQAVADKRLDPRTLPGSYATAYVLARMEPHELQAAAEAHLVRPEVTRPALVDFLRKIRAKVPQGRTNNIGSESSKSTDPAGSLDWALLRKEKADLLVRLAELDRLLGPQTL